MLEVGHQIGGYTIIRLIGKGGMSEVYLGQHRRVSRRAAIKVLIPELSQKAAIVDRFFSEARATSLIRHPPEGGSFSGLVRPKSARECT